MNRRDLTVLTITLTSLTHLAGAASDATYVAAKATGELLIDGKLDEPAWRQATPGTNFVRLKERAAGGPPPSTRLRILADADAVYLGLHCAEPRMGELKDAPIHRDGPVWSRDVIEMFVDPEGAGVNYYQFVLSAGNTQWDAYFIEGGNTMVGEYSSFWQSAVHKSTDFWSMEVRIPLAALYHTDSAAFSDTWRINVCRQRRPVPQLLTWAKLRFGFHEPTSFHRVSNLPKKHPRFDLRMTDMKVSLDEEVQGQFVGSLEIATEATQAAAEDYRLALWADDTTVATEREVSVAPGKSSVVLTGLRFPRLGKTLIKAALTSANGELRHGTYTTTRLRYTPIEIDVQEPFYANCIFPNQAVKEIAGEVRINLPAPHLRGAELSVRLEGPGAPTAPFTTKLRGTTQRFSLDASSLKIGSHTLTCGVRSGGNVVAQNTVTIRKLAVPASKSYVYIDEHLRLVVDDRPLFVRGYCGGGAFGMSAALWQTRSHPPNAFFNAFRCQVGMAAERLDKAERENCKHDRAPSQKVFEEMLKRIDENRENTTFWWYYLADEPECRGLSPVYLKHQYDFIKEHDPYHPVMIITRAPERYTECADILNPHPYLGPRVDANGKRRMKSMERIRGQIRTVLSAGKGRIAPWLTPQAFSYGFIDSQADYPTFLELRCMVYTAICSGCKGFTPFAYSSMFKDLDLRLGVPFVYETLFCLDRFLLDPSAPIPAEVDAPDDGVDVWIKRVGDETVFIAVNLLDRPVSATIGSKGFEGIDRFSGFREDASLGIDGNTVELSFAPHQAYIFTHPGMTAVDGAGTGDVSTLLEQIRRADAALRKPGNLLFGHGREIEWGASHTYIAPKSLYSLTDGITDTLGFKAISGRRDQAWITMTFSAFKPRFRRMRLYTGTVADLELQGQRDGDWQTISRVQGNTDPVIDLIFDKPVCEPTLRIFMTKLHPMGQRSERGWGGGSQELCEIEMYE